MSFSRDLYTNDLAAIRGRVVQLSGDAFVNEQTGTSYFRAEVEVPPSELRKLGDRSKGIIAGTPAQAVIITRKRTALEYLIEPLTRSLWRSGSEQ